MITISKKKISTDFKIFLSIILLCFVCIGAFNLKDTLAYSHLKSVASALPTYDGIQLPTGTMGSQDCYAVEGSSSCESLQITSTTSDTATVNKLFFKATAQQGITWHDTASEARWLSSRLFERDGRQYQLYISHESSGRTSVSLVQY